MTAEKPKIPEFKPKQNKSPFVVDHFNTRGGKGGKKGGIVTTSGAVKSGKNISLPKFKGGSGGDR
jgi:hypothetical protein